MKEFPTPYIGISQCLLGAPVRYDGGHKRHTYLAEVLQPLVEYVPVCPEVELGLGVPRPTLQLRQTEQGARLVFSQNPDEDITVAMQDFAKQKLATLPPLHGYVVKKKSPSCGMERVPVSHGKHSRYDGVGAFTQVLLQAQPWLPVEEEGRLFDRGLRENFLERVYALARWQTQPLGTLHDFMVFHRDHKLQLMARGAHHYSRLGNRVANSTRENLEACKQAYLQDFMHTMRRRPDMGKHVNVLQHIMGYFKRALSAADKQELLQLFEQFKRGEVSLHVPLALLRHYVRRYQNEYLATQHYLAPYPSALNAEA